MADIVLASTGRLFMFKKEQSLGIRIWHWGNSAAIFLLFLTVFLRKVVFGKESQNIIMAKTQEMGILLTEPQSKDLIRAIRHDMWQWHPVIGFVAIGFLVFRVVIYFQNKSKTLDVSNKPLMYKIVKKSHALFYVLLGVMGITGGALYWEKTLQLSEGLTHKIEEFHEALMWFFILFVIVHILGVIKAELGEDKGLISDMINGGK